MRLLILQRLVIMPYSVGRVLLGHLYQRVVVELVQFKLVQVLLLLNYTLVGGLITPHYF
jgi:hypothetical protein